MSAAGAALPRVSAGPAEDSRLARAVLIAVAVGYIGVFLLLLHWLWPDGRWEIKLSLAVLPLLPLVPAIFRYSRILWMHFDTPGAW